MKWNDLTMKERSDLMSLFLKTGVGSLSDMRHIYDGLQDTEEYSGGTLKESNVSAALNRDQWNNLYKQGKVGLSEIPRKYQPWIEGENSNVRREVIARGSNSDREFSLNGTVDAIKQDIRNSKESLQTIGETALDFTPVIGDIKGLTYDPYMAYKDNGIGAGLITAGLGLVGLIPMAGDAIKKSSSTFLNEIISRGIFDRRTPFLFNRKLKDTSKFMDEIRNYQIENINVLPLDEDTYIKNIGDNSYGEFNNMNNTATISIPKNTSLFQNAAKRKIRGTTAHEVEHGVQDIREKRLGFYPLTYFKGVENHYYEPNIDVLRNLGYDETFPMLKYAGQWKGSPNELLSELHNLATRGYIYDGKINKIGKRALQGRFGLSEKELDTAIEALTKNGEINLKELNHNKNKVSTKEIFEDLADSYQDEIVASLLGAGIGTLGSEIVFGEHTKNKDGGLLHKYSGEENNDSGIFKDLYNWAKNKYNEIFSKNKTTRFKRILENDSPTKQLSEEYEDMVNEAMKNSTIIDKNYTPYIKDKEIVIPKVGRASTNMLDSLAKYSAVVGLPVSDAIGLAARETKFGAQPNIFVGYPSDYPSMESFNENNRAIMNMSYARNFGGIPSAYLLNDEAWYDYDTPNKSMQNFVSKTGSPFEHALYYFKTGDYNRGERGYNNTVKQLGKQIFNTPVIQQWWKESKYNPQNKHNNGGLLFSGEGSAVSNKKRQIFRK